MNFEVPHAINVIIHLNWLNRSTIKNAKLIPYDNVNDKPSWLLSPYTLGSSIEYTSNALPMTTFPQYLCMLPGLCVFPRSNIEMFTYGQTSNISRTISKI